MSQNSGPFLASSHGHPTFNPRLPSSLSPSLKRPGNGPMSIGNTPNASIGPNMNVSPSSSLMRPSNSMGLIKPGTIGMNPIEKSNTMPYSSRYTRKAWPMSRSIHDKNIRGHDDHESPYLRTGLPSHGGIPSDSISGSSFTIEPAADDDEADDICFSSRHMAAARFQRNQRFIHEIFNEVCIPDLRSNVNVDRILTLRRQVGALKTHRETFEKDLNELEEKHLEKKRKFAEVNEKFYSEYAEASSKNLSQEKINEILQKYEAMEKLQKEKQLLLQQQQQQQQQIAATPLQSQTQSLPSTTTTAVSPLTAPAATKTEPVSTVDVPQQQTPTPPPPVMQAQLPPAQSTTVPLPPTQPIPTQLPPSHLAPTQLSSSHPVEPKLPPAQPVQHQLPPPPPPPITQQILASQQQQPQSTPTSQGYPMMHPGGGGYAPAPGYGHPQQTQYRPPMNHRPVQYPSNVQWQQQQQQSQQQQQWQTNTYDPRYYNPYPSNVQWSQQQQPQQQWAPNQQQQQQPQMYANGVHYGYSGTTAGWNTGAHPSQQYAYPQNPSYDPSLVSAPPQQQYYSAQQMHNPPQVYDYGPPPPQQQQQPPQMN